VTLLGHNFEFGFVAGHFTGRVEQSAYCVRVFLCPNEMTFNPIYDTMILLGPISRSSIGQSCRSQRGNSCEDRGPKLWRSTCGRRKVSGEGEEYGE